MPDLTFTIGNCKDRVKALEPSLANYADFNARFAREYPIVISEYMKELIDAVDPFAKQSNFDAPLSTGSTPTIDTDAFDIYKVPLPDGQRRLADNNIYLEKATGTFFKVPRVELDDIVTEDGPGQTLYAFFETQGNIHLVIKDGEFTDPADFCYNFYRILSADVSDDDNELDVKLEDFETICERVSERMIA